MTATKQFETKPNTGALFRNDRKSSDTDRDYAGTLNVEGTEFWISGWLKEAKSGQKYLSLSVKPKGAPTTKVPATKTNDFDDGIPF
jgi:hypothetical protein